MVPPPKSPEQPDSWVVTVVDFLDGLLRRALGMPYSLYGTPGTTSNAGDANDRDYWSRVAETTGLKLTLDKLGRARLSGVGDGATLLCAADRPKNSTVPMRVSATGRRGDLRVVLAAGAPPGAWRTGDVHFDQTCACYGDPVSLAATLTADARTSLRALILQDGQLEKGCASLPLPVPTARLTDAVDALRLVQEVVARTQYAFADQVERLLSIADSDPNPTVQARALHALVTTFPVNPRVRKAVSDAAAGTQPHLKLVALLHLGEVTDAVSVLRERPIRSMVDLVLDTAEREALSQLLIVAADSSDLKVLEGVATGARRLPLSARLAVLTTLGRCTRAASPTDRALELTGALLASTFPADPDPPIADPALDAAMLAFIDHPVEVLALAAARTLGDHGTQESLPAMRDAVRRVSPQVSRRLSSAIAEIQERFGEEHAGRVSLAEPDVRGRVSVLPGREAPDSER